jgi:poly(hydroxyalkanoate) granule-associated protein
MMVKKFKAGAKKAGNDKQLADAIKGSAQEIWLAGLGAFTKAQEEGQKMFKNLVRDGNAIHQRTVKLTGEKMNEVTSKVNEVTSRVTEVATGLQKQANGTWDKLEGVFEARVERALSRLGVPTSKEVSTLSKRVEELSRSVAMMGGRKPAAKRASARKSA